jgi:hypothetical protein
MVMGLIAGAKLHQMCAHDKQTMNELRKTVINGYRVVYQ